MAKLLAFLLIGRLLVWMAQRFPFQNLPIIGNLMKRKSLQELIHCDLCLGVWVYTVLALLFGIDFFSEYMKYQIPLIGEFFTGMSASFFMHIFAIGWQMEFGEITVE
jgi:hypothetical protein